MPNKIIVLALFSSTLVGAAPYNFLRSGVVTPADAERSLIAELGTSSDASDANDGGRLHQIEGFLKTVYSSLPQSADGKLPHQVVRYILHRVFTHHRGWFIRGLEAGNDTWAHDDSAPSANLVKEWVPSFLQDILARRLGKNGTDFHGLVALAAALEDLIRKEAMERLELAYRLHGISMLEHADEEDAEDILGTYYLTFLLAGNFSASTADEVERKKRIFAARYAGWPEAEEWLRELQKRHFRPANRIENKGIDFGTVARAAVDIGETYYKFNDLECRSLKKTLRDLEGKQAGRVRLSSFYKTGLYSHWRFTEKADYLRTLGALDDSDPKQPSVILANYIMSRPNCLEASSLYAICCRNECEDLMGTLESKIGKPFADAHAVAEVVAALPSDTINAPRNLSASLIHRLDQVAKKNGGKIPLHGRLFAQWMHHAYPRECPYPHEVGTVSPQTPDEWMEQTGQGDSQASAEEMLRHVESDSCANVDAEGKVHKDCQESSELPWSEVEELLHDPQAIAPSEEAQDASLTMEEILIVHEPPSYSQHHRGKSHQKADIAVILGVVLSLGLIFWQVINTSSRAAEHREKLQSSGRRLIKAAVLTLISFAAYAFDLLDQAVFVCAVVGGLVVVVVFSFLERSSAQQAVSTGSAAKSVV